MDWLHYVLIGAAVAVGVIGFAIGYFYRKNVAEAKVEKAEDAVKRLYDEAQKKAEEIRKEKVLEAKDEAYKIRSEADKEIKERRNEIKQNERRLFQREESLDKKLEAVESREQQLNERTKKLDKLEDEINALFHITNDFELTFKFAIYPIVKAFETALNRDLLLEKEKKNYFFEFDVKEITRASLRERYDAYRVAKETGFLTVNEIRRAENLDYIEGMDVINVGLGAVLYNIDTHQYYSPNTNTTTDADEQGMLEAHVEEQEFVADGNSSE